jgi:hypothetical protein
MALRLGDRLVASLDLAHAFAAHTSQAETCAKTAMKAAIEEVCKMVAPQLLEARASNLPLSFSSIPLSEGKEGAVQL